MERVSICASAAYDVCIGSGLLQEAGERVAALGGAQRMMVVSDERVFSLYGQSCLKSLAAAGLQTAYFTVPQGEASKSLFYYGELLEALCRAQLSRKDIILALGGGVVGDLAGFAAATYLRGIRYVQLPTTLLAAVDSSVGGKTAINLPNGKNLVGCFYQPALVLCDTDTLQTLDEREMASGSAEVIKYAMLGDERFMDDLIRTPIAGNLEAVIARCAAMKRDFVQEDERDQGRRMLLNFGHTLGHAAEKCSGYTLAHGYGVAMGMDAVTQKAEEKGLCEKGTTQKLKKALKAYRLPDTIPFDAADMLRVAQYDKKNASGKVKLIIPERVGKCTIHEIPEAELASWIPGGKA